jgi:predicted Zn finger-like uncharacterized protein
MILTCPECATSYSVDDAKIGAAGREVRCAACGTRWHAKLPAPEPHALTDFDIVAVPAVEAEAPAPPAEEPALRVRSGESPARTYRARTQAKKSVKRAAAAGAVWGGMGLMFVVLIGAAYLFRVDVVRLWPKSASAYAQLRVPVNPLGLEFEDVDAHPALKDGRAALIVTGKIRNTKDSAIESPPLRIALVDKTGKRLATKIADPENALIPPGEARHFSIALVDPPIAAEDAEVAFAMDRKVSRKALAAPAPSAQAVSLRGPVAESISVPAATSPTPIDARPLPPESPHAIAPGHE